MTRNQYLRNNSCRLISKDIFFFSSGYPAQNIFASSIVLTITDPHFVLKEPSLGEGSMGFLALLFVIHFTSNFTVLTVLSNLWKWDNGEKSRMQD